MYQKVKSVLNKKTGFTLVELLVVITIIAVLSAVGLISYSTITSKAKDTKRVQDLKTISEALELYANSSLTNYRGYPPVANDNCSEANSNILYEAIKKYIGNQEVPVDPVTRQKYCYYTINSGKSYRLYAKVDNVDASNAQGCGNQNDPCYTINSSDLTTAAPNGGSYFVSTNIASNENNQGSQNNNGSNTNNSSGSTTDMSFCTTCAADVNKDGRVSINDRSATTSCQSKGINGNAGQVSCSQTDINKDGVINDLDINCVDSKFGQMCSQTSPSPSPSPSIIACTPNNASICGNKNCGSVTGTDNCGQTRTVNCGASCPAGQSCGGGGTPNVCGNMTYTFASGYANTQGPMWYYYYNTRTNTPTPAIYGTAQMLAKEWWGEPDNNYWTAGSNTWMWLDAGKNTAGDTQNILVYWKAPSRGEATITITEKRLEPIGKGNGFSVGVGYVNDVGDYPSRFTNLSPISGTNNNTITIKENYSMRGNGDAIVYYKTSVGSTFGDASSFSISVSFLPD